MFLPEYHVQSQSSLSKTAELGEVAYSIHSLLDLQLEMTH